MDELKEELEKRPVVVQESMETAEEKVPEQVEPAPAAAEQLTKEQVWCPSALLSMYLCTYKYSMKGIAIRHLVGTVTQFQVFRA